MIDESAKLEMRRRPGIYYCSFHISERSGIFNGTSLICDESKLTTTLTNLYMHVSEVG